MIYLRPWPWGAAPRPVLAAGTKPSAGPAPCPAPVPAAATPPTFGGGR